MDPSSIPPGHFGLSRAKVFEEFTRGYHCETTGDWVDMSRARRCIKHTKEDFLPLPHCHERETYTNGASPISIPRAEERGITLRQLQAVKANADRRCFEEKWVDPTGEPKKPDTITMYDIHQHIILPFTAETKRSFVESLPSTAGAQPPRFFISHWWGETTQDFMHCIEQFVQDFQTVESGQHNLMGGGMTEDTPIWICAYANNQWNLEGDVTKDPDRSSFAQAMRLANGRTLTILDKHGVVFSRIWCIYELYKTLVHPPTRHSDDRKPCTEMVSQGSRTWALYTANPHSNNDGKYKTAVGIVPGGAPDDISNLSTLQREKHFPFSLIMKVLTMQVEKAVASKDTDRIHILNAIVQTDSLDAEPPRSHTRYASLNQEVRACIASSPGILQAGSRQTGEEWLALLTAISYGTMTREMSFDFAHSGWKGLTGQQSVQLMEHLPSSLENLNIRNASFGLPFIDALSKWIQTKSRNLESLHIENAVLGGIDGGRQGGKYLARALSRCTDITELVLERTDLVGSRNAKDWSDLLSTTQTLMKFECTSTEYHTCSGYLDDMEVLNDAYTYHDACLLAEGMKQLAIGIAGNTSLMSIELAGHDFGKEGIEALGLALKGNQTITSVVVDEGDEEMGESIDKRIYLTFLPGRRRIRSGHSSRTTSEQLDTDTDSLS